MKTHKAIHCGEYVEEIVLVNEMATLRWKGKEYGSYANFCYLKKDEDVYISTDLPLFREMMHSGLWERRS